MAAVNSATRFSEIEPALRRPLSRRLVRRAALGALGAVPRNPRPGVRIVHYHHVFDDEVEGFRRQLELFRRTYEPVTLTEAVGRLVVGAVTGGELVVTFDDGFRNQLENGCDLLDEAGIRATFFLITDLVGASAAEVERICRERLHLPRPVAPLSWDDARELVRRGHEIGSHTRSHPDLASLADGALSVELAGSRAILEEQLGVPVAHLSAPYGDPARFSDRVSAAARRAGYASCATAQRGRNTDGGDVFALRRDHLVAAWPVSHARTFLARA